MQNDKLSGQAEAHQEGFGTGIKPLLCAILLASSGFTCVPVPAEPLPELKFDTPKLDTTPPKPPTVLHGAIEHAEKGAAKSAKLKGNANDNAAKGGLMKFFTGKAKSDTNSPLKGKAKNDTLTAQTERGIGIIGVKFVLSFGKPPIINRVFPGTPAAIVGLRPNDMILAVDGVPTLGLSKDEVYQMIVGTPNTPVTLSVRREGDFVARTMNRMDFNDITDPMVRRDYLLSM